MGTTIQSNPVAKDTFNKLWNVTVCDYSYGGVNMDFETLLISVTTSRAATIESEITPVSTLVRRRNEQLEDLGKALSDLTGAQKTLEDKDKSVTECQVDDATAKCVNNIKSGLVQYNDKVTPPEWLVNKSTCAEAIELVKTRMDKLNNDSQNDLTRLQSLVDKRDDSFETASSLMSKVSDTRGTAIKSMV